MHYSILAKSWIFDMSPLGLLKAASIMIRPKRKTNWQRRIGRTRHPRKPQSHTRRLVQKPVAWAVGIVLGAISAIVVTMLTSIPGQVLDIPALADLVRSGKDIRITAEIINEDDIFDVALPFEYFIPADDPLLNSAELQSMTAFTDRLRHEGAFDVGTLSLRLIFEGRRNQRIQVSNISLSNIHTMTPVRGTLISANAEGADENEPIVFDLSESLPLAREAPKDDNPGPPYFKKKTISLADHEQVVVLVEVYAKPKTATEFTLDVQYLIGGETRRLTIDNHDQPFRVTSISCNEPGSYYSDYERAYTMEVSPQGFALALASDPHRVQTGWSCPL
ncbi:MAG: hypothetical protein JXA67_15665 [Micromonosporaceae bacterium]|nr:hypothetical protein [Micromonosporaceae bacterium]